MSEKIINPIKRTTRRYYLEFGVSLTAYVAVIFLRHYLLHGSMRHADERSQIVVALLPLIPTLFLFAAIVRFVRATDEFYRRIFIESLALAGGMTALLAVTYGLIESDYFPYLSAWWTYGTFMVAWMIATLFVQRQYR
jgi:hypothetical protein